MAGIFYCCGPGSDNDSRHSGGDHGLSGIDGSRDTDVREIEQLVGSIYSSVGRTYANNMRRRIQANLRASSNGSVISAAC